MERFRLSSVWPALPVWLGGVGWDTASVGAEDENISAESKLSLLVLKTLKGSALVTTVSSVHNNYLKDSWNNHSISASALLYLQVLVSTYSI